MTCEQDNAFFNAYLQTSAAFMFVCGLFLLGLAIVLFIRERRGKP